MNSTELKKLIVFEEKPVPNGPPSCRQVTGALTLELSMRYNTRYSVGVERVQNIIADKICRSIFDDRTKALIAVFMRAEKQLLKSPQGVGLGWFQDLCSEVLKVVDEGGPPGNRTGE